jgi:hypothetical protein
MELWNKNDGFDVYYYNDGYYRNDNNKSFFDEALARDWKLGASGSDDNHKGTHGTRNDYRMAVIAPALTRADIYNALKSRNFYSTSDKNLKLSFLMNGNQMGSSISAGNTNVVISAYDTENFNRIELLKEGTVIRTWNSNSSNPEVTDTLSTMEGEYYYVRVRQSDGDQAISSPIHIDGSSSTTVSAPHATGTPTPFTSTPTPPATSPLAPSPGGEWGE